MSSSSLDQAPLGRDTAYPTQYDPSVLFAVNRETNRAMLPFVPNWVGADIWNAYEVSWLNARGKPLVAMARFVVPHGSANIIESKSFKLYLNSFNESRFQSINEVKQRLENDLSKVAGANIEVVLTDLHRIGQAQCAPLAGINIDEADVEIEHYQPNANLLKCVVNAQTVSETLTSDLLKSNCPVTGQPDWGSLQIQYTGPKINRESLLKYIISLRRHTEFHEHCVEKIYCDIWQACQPEFLFVYACYTRRGGLDINPWRASRPTSFEPARTPRQ
ncbi:MAG TPA: NADPH-dependent 7-cyano-7-deazaguanine reductase QueF [Pusillimonas sp.]|jgi:7-cyano-7-deazaguanine reductase|nr:NADPH-dependent 7-cyano-7-deazaguanine reductase QueF [Pusillimonas sp.]|tara:strand:- start:138187 stop:139011 length:825 start_codon:yes stop_codon:yes gene_type:complete